MTSLTSVGDTQNPWVEVFNLLVTAVSGSPGDEGGNGLDRGGGDPQPGILMQIRRMLLLWRMDPRTQMKSIDYGGD